MALVATEPTSAQPLGPEPWLQFGPYEWGFELYDDVVLIGGAWQPHDVITYYPSSSEGEGAPLDGAGAPYPVVFFQHAGGSHYRNYDYLFTRMASHGLIVVSMDHTAIESASPFWETHGELFTETVDLVFSWSVDSASFLFGAVDAERIGFAGHSHGAAFVAMRDYRPMNPAGDYEVDCISLLTVCPDATIADYVEAYAGMPPHQVIYGSKDRDGCTAHGQSIAMIEPGQRPRHYTYVVGGAHYGFTDDGALNEATIDRVDHHRAAVSSIVSFHAYFLNGDASALPYLRGEEPLLDGAQDIRYQWLDVERMTIDDFEDVVPAPSIAIAGVPGQTFMNGFLSDTFVDVEAGVDLVRSEIQALLPIVPSTPHTVLFFEDDALGPDVYETALDREVQAGRIATPVFTDDHTTFAALIGSQPWDLVVAANQNGSSGSTHPFDGPLSAYVCSGGKLILSDFRVESSTADDVMLCSNTDFDDHVNFTTMTSVDSLFDGTLQMTNPGWGIATYGLSSEAAVFAVNEFETGVGDPSTNSLGLSVTASGMETFREAFLLQGDRGLYHPTWGLELAWSASGGRFVETLADQSGSGFDATSWSALAFRVLQLHDDPLNPPGFTKDFTVRLVDRDGDVASLDLSQADQGPLRGAVPPSSVTDWKSVFETYRFPLSDFETANPSLTLSDLERVEFLFDVSPTGRIFLDDLEFTGGGGVTVDVMDPVPPVGAVALWPNPFHAGSGFSVRVAGSAPTRLDVFDVAGRRVRTLTSPTEDHLRWDGRDERGRFLPPGVYFVDVRSGVRSTTMKAVMTTGSR